MFLDLICALRFLTSKKKSLDLSILVCTISRQTSVKSIVDLYKRKREEDFDLFLNLYWFRTKLEWILSRSSPHLFRWKMECRLEIDCHKHICYVIYDTLITLGFVFVKNKPDRIDLMSWKPLPEFVKARVLLTSLLTFSSLKQRKAHIIINDYII